MVIVCRVTTECNLGCGFCAFDRRLHRTSVQADPGKILRFAKIVAQWGRMFDSPPLISWMGGEPFLWPPLCELTVILRRQYGLRISATTNGTFLADAAMRQHIIENYAEVTISVDGVGRMHDDLRDWPGGYQWLARHVSLLSQEKQRFGVGPRLRANIVVMRDNIACLEQLCRGLAGWGIEEITFNQLGGKDRPEFFPDHKLLQEHAQCLSQLFARLRRSMAFQGVTICGARSYIERIQATAKGCVRPVLDCRPGRSFLFIHESGRVSPCSFTLAECGVPVDTIDSVKDLARLPRMFEDSISSCRPQACNDCLSTQVFGKFAKD